MFPKTLAFPGKEHRSTKLKHKHERHSFERGRSRYILLGFYQILKGRPLLPTPQPQRCQSQERSRHASCARGTLRTVCVNEKAMHGLVNVSALYFLTILCSSCIRSSMSASRTLGSPRCLGTSGRRTYMSQITAHT